MKIIDFAVENLSALEVILNNFVEDPRESFNNIKIVKLKFH